MTSRLLSIAAGTLRDVARVEAIAAAAEAGFGAVGLRFDLAPPSRGELRALRERLDDAGLVVLDVEVVRLGPLWDETLELRLVEWAASLGARHLLTVCDDPDPRYTRDGLARVAQRCRAAGLSAVLEFMPFTHPSGLADAVALAAEVGEALGGVLVDALHLERCGHRPAELAALPPPLFPYAQLCDAARPGTLGQPEALIREARSERLLPGEGRLPLRDLIAALPAGCPLSVEVQSQRLESSSDARERARRCHAATRQLLAGSGAGAHRGGSR